MLNSTFIFLFLAIFLILTLGAFHQAFFFFFKLLPPPLKAQVTQA